tara:strand:- start:1062 stop:1367 length:306 start_codon:yes stop_codon:yes gene_type:complete
MIWSALRRLIQRYGFFKREPDIYHRSGSTVGPLVSADEVWAAHGFFTAEKRRNERLAQIARERTALKEQLAKAIRDKKARAPIYQALRALSVEELRVETGK